MENSKEIYRFFFLYFRLLIFLLKIILATQTALKLRKTNDYFSEIKTVIEVMEIYGPTLPIKFFYNQYCSLPDEIYVNGNKSDCYNSCPLPPGKYNISLRFNYPINSTQSMFSQLSNIVEVDLSNFEASKVTTMRSMFYQCSKLKIIHFGNINTSSLEIMRGMFYGCSNLESIDLSNLDTSNVNTMYLMFYNCYNLTSINFGNIDTSSVENMESLFDGCSNLVSINLQVFNTSKVKTMYSMFHKCTQLENITFWNTKTFSLESMRSMFNGCYKLTFIDLSIFDTSKVTIMYRMFYNCYDLTSINFGNIDISSVEDMEFLFYGCSSLASINISTFDTTKVKTISFMFFECKNLTEIDLGNLDTSSVENMFSLFGECHNLYSIDLSNLDTSKVKNMSSMFFNCHSLNKINFENFKTSSVKDMKNLFYGCQNLTSIDLSNFDTSEVTTFYAMFYNCKNLNKINLENLNTSSVQDMTGLFYGCEKLTSIDLSNFDTTQVTSMFLMFYNCSNLKYLNLSNFNSSQISTIKSMFENCKSLIYLDLYSFQINNNTDINYAFYKINPNVKYCINDINTKNYLLGKDKISICSDTCYNENNTKIDINNNICINSCINNGFPFEYKNICAKNCSEGTLMNDNICEDNPCENISSWFCQNNTPTGYYLDNSDGIYKKCFENCDYCYGSGNETINNCKQCKSNLIFIKEYKYETNCFKKCDYNYYFNELNEYICTEDLRCPDDYNKLIKEKNKCIDECKNDDNFLFEYNNNCYRNCPEETYQIDSAEYKCVKNESSNSYYLDIENQTYKDCYGSCEECSFPGNKTHHNCKKCKTNYAFYNNSENISNCYEICENYYYFDESNDYHCVDTCPEKYNKAIIEINKCTDDCKKDYSFPYEYNNSCYRACPRGTYILEDKTDYICFEHSPDDSYYLDIDKNIFRKCYNTCQKCIIGGNVTNHNCLECKNNYTFYNDSENISNCYKKCNSYYYFNELNELICTDTCIKPFNKLITSKNKCIDDCKNDDLYRFEYNDKCYKNCPNYTLTDDNNYKCFKDENMQSTIIQSINEDYYIIINKYTEYIDNYTNLDEEAQKFRIHIESFNVSENKQGITKKENNALYQVTTTDLQKINNNISKIDLGLCESRLKEIYKIDKSLPLIIFKIDYFSPDILIPIISYEIYHPLNKIKLNLSYCEDILIKLNIPVNIDEKKLFKYDPNSQYYNDNCFPYTTDNDTDIILEDRRQEFNDKNLSLCEKNCNYTGYNTSNKESICSCNIKNKMELISEIIDNPNKLSNVFNSDDTSSSSGASNIISLKCTKVLFSSEGLKENISSYILIIFIIHFLVSITFFLKCGYNYLISMGDEIISEKEKIHQLNPVKNQIILPTAKTTFNRKKKKKGKMKKKIHFPPKKNYNLNFYNNNDNNNKKAIKNIINNNNKISSLMEFDITEANNNNNELYLDKNDGKNKNSLFHSNNKNSNETSLQKINEKIKLEYNDYELNTMDYKDAILNDKRNWCEYYFALIKSKNAILFSFCPRKDYNSLIIKSCIFSLSFSICYIANFIFFNDEILHLIYENCGNYDALYFLPMILISFFISYYITVILKLIFLSERNLTQVRKQTSLSLAYNVFEKNKSKLVIKYIIFFILGLIFLVFFWMLLSSFGAVYPNTQMFVFKNTLISFTISLIYPIFMNIFPTILRICSLNLEPKDNEYTYKVSKVLQIL